MLFDVRVGSSCCREDVLRADCWKATGAASLLQELGELGNRSKKVPSVWPVSVECVQNHGEIKITEINQQNVTRRGTSYISNCLRFKVECDLFHSFACATSKPVLGMCLKPWARHLVCRPPSILSLAHWQRCSLLISSPDPASIDYKPKEAGKASTTSSDRVQASAGRTTVSAGEIH